MVHASSLPFVSACFPTVYFSLHYINSTGIPCNQHSHSSRTSHNYYTACRFRIVSFRLPPPGHARNRLRPSLLTRGLIRIPYTHTSRRPDNNGYYTDAPDLPYHLMSVRGLSLLSSTRPHLRYYLRIDMKRYDEMQDNSLVLGLPR